jgi:hypothetical protein
MIPGSIRAGSAQFNPTFYGNLPYHLLRITAGRQLKLGSPPQPMVVSSFQQNGIFLNNGVQ